MLPPRYVTLVTHLTHTSLCLSCVHCVRVSLQVGTYDYAGCMTVPRLLHLDHDRLHQSPAPELLTLRRGEAWHCSHETLAPETSVAMPGVVNSNFLDIEVGSGAVLGCDGWLGGWLGFRGCGRDISGCVERGRQLFLEN